jgi:AcrR family transcriptional regulator
MSRVLASEHRTALIAATIRVMARDGVAAASTRRVAAEAGVAQAMVHYVFGTKIELYRAALEEMSETLVRAVAEGLAPRPHWSQEAAGAAEAVWDIAEANPETALLLVELTTYALREPELRDLAIGLYESYDRLAEDAVRALYARAELEEPRLPAEEVAPLVVAGLNGLVMSLLVHGDRERSRRDLGNLVDSLVAAATGTVPTRA